MIRGCALVIVLTGVAFAALMLVFASLPVESRTLLLCGVGAIAAFAALLAVRLSGIVWFLLGRSSVRRRR